MAFKESVESHKRIKDISEAEHIYEAREKDVDPEKAHFLAIYENLARSKTAAYEEYLEDPEKFLEEENSRRQSVNDLETELIDLEGGRDRMEKISNELKDKVKDRIKYLDKKVTILSKLKNKLDTTKDDISKLKERNTKLEDKIKKLEGSDTKKHNKLREKYINQIRENEFDIKEKEDDIEKLKKQNVEEKFKRIWEDIWALQKRERTLPDYDTLKRELEMRLEEDRKEVERREIIRSEFELLQRAGVTPESLRNGAEVGEQILYRLYDEQEDIAEAVKEKKKVKLVGKAISGSVQSVSGMVRAVLRRGDNLQNSEDISMGLFKLRAAARGIFKNRKMIDKGIMNIPSLKEVQETTELYNKPKEKEEEKETEYFRHEILHQSSILVNESGPDTHEKKEETITPPDDNDLPVIEADESLPVIEADESLPVVETDESIPVTIEEKDNEIDIADKVSKKIFDGMVREYTKYIESGSDDDKGINAFFRAMKKAEIKPRLIKEEGINVKRWMKSIQKWAKDIESLDRKDTKKKLSENFFSTIVKIHTAEDLKKTGVVRDITGDMFKQYLLTRRLQVLNQ